MAPITDELRNYSFNIKMTDICYRNLKILTKGIVLLISFCLDWLFTSIIEFSTFGTIRIVAILFTISSFFRENILSEIQQTERHSMATANQIQTLWREASKTWREHSAFTQITHFDVKISRWQRKQNKPKFFQAKYIDILSIFKGSEMQHS